MKHAYRNDLNFALMTVGIILATHAIAYLTHEFSHSLTAWTLWYMKNPVALDYGTFSPATVVLLSEVGDNVQYDPILSGGHGLAVTMIALAGPYMGNALLYICLCAFADRLRTRGVVVSSFTFWLMLMCAVNVWSYVPIRAITTHADIAFAASGLHISVWTLFPFLFVPSLILVGHFFTRSCPLLIPAIATHQLHRTALIVAVTNTWFFTFFTFFGGFGLSGGYGAFSQAFSVVSAVLLMPLAVVWLWAHCISAAPPFDGSNASAATQKPPFTY